MAENTEARNHLSDETKVSTTKENVPGKSRNGKTNPPLSEAKLRSLFILFLQGKTQTECARHFNVTDRTIRNWSKRFNELRTDILQTLNPNQVVLHALLRFDASEAELTRWKSEAEKDGDSRAKLRCNQELRKLERERQAFLEKIGLFTNFRPQFNIDKDPTMEEADYIARIAAGLLQFNNFDSEPNDLDEEP